MTLYLKNLGKIGEQRAVGYLKNNGFIILKKNFRSYNGEIDLIAKKEKTIYFIEVKTRSNLRKGQPWESVNKRKLFHMKNAANYFLLKFPYKDYKLKLAVISIILTEGKESLRFFDNILD